MKVSINRDTADNFLTKQEYFYSGSGNQHHKNEIQGLYPMEISNFSVQDMLAGQNRSKNMKIDKLLIEFWCGEGTREATPEELEVINKDDRWKHDLIKNAYYYYPKKVKFNDKEMEPVKASVKGRMKLNIPKYPTLARVLSSQTPVDTSEKKKFATTVRNMINNKYKYMDIELKDIGGNWMKIEVGDMIANGLRSIGVENFKQDLTDLFSDMKDHHTYKTITPNWWEPYSADAKASGDILIGLGQELDPENGDPDNPDLPE